MRSMDIPITPRSRALILRYEHDRPVIESAARDALLRSSPEADRDVAIAVLHPHDPDVKVRMQQRAQDWVWAFNENERFAAALLKKESELGLDHLPVYLFGCAPLALMLHLESCLPRRPLRVYQQAQDGTWSLGHGRAQPATPEDFLQVEGLPQARQGGRGHVALIVEVTRSIRDKALAEFQQRYPSQLLATVCLRPVAGPSPTAVTHPGQVSRAAEQFRGVLDTLHQHLEGAESVLLAMDCPASFAAALGSAINLNTQHPLRLHHFHSESQHYVPVYLLSASGFRTTTSATEPSGTQTPLRSEIDGTPVTNPGPLFRHLGGRWSLHYSLLLNLGSLLFHVQQGGAVKDAGRTKTLEAIVWNVLEMLHVFEPERPMRDLPERRQRRYLIWLFQACRLSALTRDARAPAAELERVTIEVAGLQTFPGPHERYAQQRVRLEAGDEREPLELAVYFQRRRQCHGRAERIPAAGRPLPAPVQRRRAAAAARRGQPLRARLRRASGGGCRR